MEDKVKQLVDQYRYNEGTARAYVEAKGKCVYCGVNLLDNLSTYFSADIDHLLPKSKYPELETVTENWVLSCRACNAMKGKMDVENIPWTAKDAVTNHKSELIQIIREKLHNKRSIREKELSEIKVIVQNSSNL